MMSEQSQPSITSLTQELSLLTEGKKHWEAETSEALRQSIQALRDYAYVLRTTLSQVEATAALLHEECENRLKALFDEPMEDIRSKITAIRDDFHQSLREDIVPHRAIPERLLPMCVLLETYVAVNGEVMRLPPDVMEGFIPMVGRGNSRVFYREMTRQDVEAKYWAMDRVQRFSLPRTITDADLSSILRQHDWCVVTDSRGHICGGAHFYDDSRDERAFLFHRDSRKHSITVDMDTTDEALVIPIVENVLRHIGRSKGSRLE